MTSSVDPFHWKELYVKIFFIAVVITSVLTPFIRWLAIKAGAVDFPSNIKIHSKPTPRLGGVGIFFGFLFSLILTGSLTHQQKGLILGATCALIVGILDDLRSVPAALKLLVLFSITIFLAHKGVLLNLVPGFFWINFVLTLFWIVGVTSAFNAIDHMDGLATGLTFFASLAYAYVAVQNGQWSWGALSVALMGSCIGFLFYNFPPASIFMGDAGSFFLGYSLAAISVMGAWSTNPFKAIAVPVFILGLPVFDLMYVVVRRKFHKMTKGIRQIVTFSAKDHFSHRLLALGMSQRQALFFTYFVMLALGMGAVAMRYVLKIEAIMLCVQFVTIAFLIVILMEFAIRNKQQKNPDDFN
ncbi:MAG: undecaprenyl/decaprenyl-phosphate alpha-N-acetylglucosaminyl 1-phosphate transferase [Candidatus Omnitrophica bacterium]|nr:undecaprenyl/decaprenyl-phosphate alpha-N-acetylglucosaminyl 1-phosphate transferase [Candidatus Omnitrophota bacterium]